MILRVFYIYNLHPRDDRRDDRSREDRDRGDRRRDNFSMPVRPGVPPPGVALPPGPRPGGVLGQAPGMSQGNYPYSNLNIKKYMLQKNTLITISKSLPPFLKKTLHSQLEGAKLHMISLVHSFLHF